MKFFSERRLFCIPGTLTVIALVSFAALTAALASQYLGGLEPCILCLYQRVPFAFTTGFALAGLLMLRRRRFALAMIALCAVCFLINAGLAFYHSGVEQKWWVSAVEGCAVPGATPGSTDWIDRIMATPAVACTDIQWVDPVLGLTMANYNVLLNLGMFILCALAWLRRCPSGSEHQKQPE